jgi:mono/diheme cytochrome c family protein
MPGQKHVRSATKTSPKLSREARTIFRSSIPTTAENHDHFQKRNKALETSQIGETNMRTILTTLTIACLSPVAAFAGDAKAGQAVYEKSCKTCHGPDGTANPAIAKMMKVDMQDLKSAEVQGMSDDDLKKIVSGKGKMRPVGAVSGSALDDVVAYVRSLKK